MSNNNMWLNSFFEGNYGMAIAGDSLTMIQRTNITHDLFLLLKGRKPSKILKWQWLKRVLILIKA